MALPDINWHKGKTGFMLALAEAENEIVTDLQVGEYRGVISDIVAVEGQDFCNILIKIPDLSAIFKTNFFHKSPTDAVMLAFSEALGKKQFHTAEVIGLKVSFEVKSRESRKGTVYYNIVAMAVIGESSHLKDLLSEDDEGDCV